MIYRGHHWRLGRSGQNSWITFGEYGRVILAERRSGRPEFVGFLAAICRVVCRGFGAPDKSRASDINKLGAKCRVCRVSMGVEISRGFGGRKVRRRNDAKVSALESAKWTPVGLHRQTCGRSAVCKRSEEH